MNNQSNADVRGTVNMEVEIYPIPVIGHKSFEDAVRSGMSSPVAAKSRSDSALIGGQRVVEACWDSDQAVFLLSGGFSLHVFISDGYTDWSIGDTATYALLRERMPSPRLNVAVSYVTSTGKREALPENCFSISRIVDKCIGKLVLRITVAHTALYFQFRGTGGWHFFFVPVKRHDNGEPFLVWMEDWD